MSTLLIGQSGGPTSAINSSLVGAILEAREHQEITKILGARYGIQGVFEENFYEIKDDNPLKYWDTTPGAILGSVRLKLKTFEEDPATYKKILNIFDKYDIKYFIYIGGNDSMDTCNKISKYFKHIHYDCKVIGLPKTVDNDLAGNHFSPGYPSGAKFIATSLCEIICDLRVYYQGRVTVVEVMGRDAGWLTAASKISSLNSEGPDLIYLPEVPFDFDQMLEDVKNIYSKKNRVLVVLSEGIKNKKGEYIIKSNENSQDIFGHVQLGGAGQIVASFITQKLGISTRAIELNLPQRCSMTHASKVDLELAKENGRAGVRYMLEGMTDKLICIKYDGKKFYHEAVDLSITANSVKSFPKEWIINNNDIHPDFINYLKPLIEGEVDIEYKNGMPVFASLDK